jgi:hypothetical protein
MIDFLRLLVHVVVSPFKSQARLEAEIVILRHELNVLRRRVSSKPRLTLADRIIFVWLYRLFPSLLTAITIIEPETVMRWYRAGFRLYWRWKSRSQGGRPRIPAGGVRRYAQTARRATREQKRNRLNRPTCDKRGAGHAEYSRIAAHIRGPLSRHKFLLMSGSVPLRVGPQRC